MTCDLNWGKLKKRWCYRFSAGQVLESPAVLLPQGKSIDPDHAQHGGTHRKGHHRVLRGRENPGGGPRNPSFRSRTPGKTVEIDEKLMDVFTAVASSGIGFAFEFMAALKEAGEKEGLSAEMSLQLAKQTVYGAASLAAESAAKPEALRDQVTSKGGTTQAGLEHLAAGGSALSFTAAVEAAKSRSIELGAEGEME